MSRFGNQRNGDWISGKARRLVEGLGIEVATPDEAREMLRLEGGALVNF